MNRKVFYALFILISSVVNILFTALIIAALFAIFFVVLHITKAPSQMYANALFASFTIGLVFSFFLYSKITTKVIKKYKLDQRYGNPPKKARPKSKEIAAMKTNRIAPSLEDIEVEKPQTF